MTESKDGRKYWNKLKQRLNDEGSQLVTKCHQLKLMLEEETGVPVITSENAIQLNHVVQAMIDASVSVSETE